MLLRPWPHQGALALALSLSSLAALCPPLAQSGASFQTRQCTLRPRNPLGCKKIRGEAAIVPSVPLSFVRDASDPFAVRHRPSLGFTVIPWTLEGTGRLLCTG